MTRERSSASWWARRRRPKACTSRSPSSTFASSCHGEARDRKIAGAAPLRRGLHPEPRNSDDQPTARKKVIATSSSLVRDRRRLQRQNGLKLQDDRDVDGAL